MRTPGPPTHHLTKLPARKTAGASRHTRPTSLARASVPGRSFTTQALHWPVEPLYTPLDLERTGFDYLRDLGFPGQYPYTRGTEPNGHRTRLWTMAQVTGFGRGQDWAKRARFMLDQGLTGLILEHDLPTTNGYDSTIRSSAARSAAPGSRSMPYRMSRQRSMCRSTSSST